MEEVQSQLEVFLQEALPYLSVMQHDLSSKITQSEKECLKQWSHREDRYLDCMLDKHGKNSQAVKDLEFRLMYWRKSTMICFQNAKNRNFEPCKNQAMIQIDDYFNKTLKSI